MDKEVKEGIIKTAVAAVLLAGIFAAERIFEFTNLQLLLLYLVPYLIVGFETIKEAFGELFEGNVFNEDFLMVIATGGAFSIAFLPGVEKHEFAEAVFVMLFFQVGEIFEEIAEGRSERAIGDLMDLKPDSVNTEKDGEIVSVSPEEVNPGDIIVIRPGEKTALDGIIIEGNSSLNTVALTGESLPREVSAGDEILSGCINMSGLLRMKVTKPFGQSTVSKIIELVENASEKKSKSERYISKFAKVYTPVVVISAVLLAFIPPLLSGSFGTEFAVWLQRALTFLVVSCPCAFVISIPLSFFAGIGGASKEGILVKGSNYLEALSHVGTVVFDKTGTLTKGSFEVSLIHSDGIDERELLHMASHVERHSTHPIAVSLKEAYEDESDSCLVEGIEEIAGQGVKANVNGKTIYVGNEKLMESVGVQVKECAHDETVIHVAIDGSYAGHIVIADKIKDDSKQAIELLHKNKVRKTVMLTGDKEETAAAVSESLGLDGYRANLLPADKVHCLEEFIKEKEAGTTLAFVGDGINDAPVLAVADIGIAMGAMGSDAAIEAADIVLMDDKPSKIVKAVRIAKRTVGIARQNTVLSIAVKIAVLILAAFGLASMWMAVFADVGVLVIAVINACRALKTEKA
ncbi:MAG: cadmium-translocating P-type ATPase [Clostridiales bacterium]|nr:cadmium-translocating P-type ATPase [Clostridiales bacterium]